MAQRKRVKRRVPTRVEPDRAYRGVFGARPASKSGDEVAPVGRGSRHGSRDSHAAKDDERDDGRDDGRAASYEAVNGAYRVIDEYLRQGQRFAEQVWLPAGSAAPAEQIGKLLERFVRSAGDMGSAWLEMMGQWSSPFERASEAPRGGAGPFRAGRSGGDDVHPAPPTVREGATRGVVVCVEAARTFEVSVEVVGSIDPGDVELGPLVSANGKLPPLRRVRLDAGSSAPRLAIRIHVPKGHPPGVYGGTLLDRRTKQPRGTVSLTLS